MSHFPAPATPHPAPPHLDFPAPATLYPASPFSPSLQVSFTNPKGIVDPNTANSYHVHTGMAHRSSFANASSLGHLAHFANLFRMRYSSPGNTMNQDEAPKDSPWVNFACLPARSLVLHLGAAPPRQGVVRR